MKISMTQHTLYKFIKKKKKTLREPSNDSIYSQIIKKDKTQKKYDNR